MSNWFDIFLRGVGSILDIGATHKHEHPKQRKTLSAEEAWAADAKAIAGDMEKAMKYVEKQVLKKKHNMERE